MYILQFSINQNREKKEHLLRRPGILLIFFRWQSMNSEHTAHSHTQSVESCDVMSFRLCPIFAIVYHNHFAYMKFFLAMFVH